MYDIALRATDTIHTKDKLGLHHMEVTTLNVSNLVESVAGPSTIVGSAQAPLQAARLALHSFLGGERGGVCHAWLIRRLLNCWSASLCANPGLPRRLERAKGALEFWRCNLDRLQG